MSIFHTTCLSYLPVNQKFLIIAAIASGLGLASAPPAFADPAAAAITHLEKILNGDVNLKVGTDTAISPHTGLIKESQIKEHIKRMALDLMAGKLDPGMIRICGNLAGVIVHKREGYDPEKVAAFAVALIKTDERWIPAPVTASFENTGVSMNHDLRQRAKALEHWMLRERSRALDTLRDEQVERMARDISATITRKELQEKSVAEMAHAFLDACRERNQLRLLGMLGGLSETLPRDWATRLRTIEQGTTPAADTPQIWQALTSQVALRAIIFEETGAKDGLFTIGYLDPAAEVQRGGVPAVNLLHIDMTRDPAGLWRLNLPAILTNPDSLQNTELNKDNPFDIELLDLFPQRLRAANPATPQATPEALWGKMQDAMAAKSPDRLLRLLALPADDPEQARLAIGRVARFWWQLHFANGGRAVVPLAFHQDGDQAMAMVQLFAFREPERTDIRAFHIIRLADGWVWQSTGRQEPTHAINEALITWRNEQDDQWRTNWANTLLKPTAKIETLKPDSPVDPAVAEGLVTNFLDAIAAGDLDASLAKGAVLGDEEGQARLLRNIGYELSTQITDIEGDIVTRAGKHWTVVCFRRRDDANQGMALMPVIATDSGPRILLELDLFVGTRQRDFLNNVAQERLEGYANEEVRADLQKLLQDLNRELTPLRR